MGSAWEQGGLKVPHLGGPWVQTRAGTGGWQWLRLADVVASDLFDWLAWQQAGGHPRAGNVVALARRGGAAPATVNRRVAAVRALFEHQVLVGVRADNPVPAPRRGQGLRPKVRGVLGH